MPAAKFTLISSKDSFAGKNLKGKNLRAFQEICRLFGHELNNNLTLISGYLQILERYIDTGEWNKAKQFVGKTLDYVHDLEKVTGSLKRIYTRKDERSTVDMIRLLENVIDLVRVKKEFNPIQFVVTLSPAHWLMEVDQYQIRQVFMNFILNGCEAICERDIDRGLLQITSRVVRDSSFEVSVSDNGIGITDENLHRLFFSSFSTKKNGVGIGMMISAQIVHLHGGFITVDSTPGRGSMFRIVFPASL
jgi:signal transduction histidine kinase